jgi:4-hydroxyphenylpyruvate dioxygenase
MRFDSAVYEGRWIDPAKSPKVAVNDPLAVDEIDHLEVFVANGRQATYYYAHCFGFTPVAYRGPETGYPDAASYVLKQNNITLVLTSPLRMTSPIAASLLRHGDTARDISIRVQNCEAFYYATMARGAESVEPPTIFEDSNGKVKRAAIKTYGDTIHSIIERTEYHGPYWPGFAPYTDHFPAMEGISDLGLERIDHIVGNVELGKMNYWVQFYERVLDFKQSQHFTEDAISTEYSALMSKVLSSGTGKIKFPINEPAQGRRKSQIDEYLDFHYGPGVQHVAMATKDILKTVSELRKRGVMFLKVPQAYYDEVPKRVGKIKEDLSQIAALGILVDRDDDGYLLQLFSKPVQDRPTLFFEIIQREGSNGFGVGNFKALFEAIEREQAERGNL